MITPAYTATATERVLPRLALNFTTAVADPRVATSRALNTATRINSSGLIEIVNADLPRFDFDPSTLVCRGQRIEESRTNLFLNSLINGTSLSTQTVVVTAVAHTISFYGTGTITLSGAATATVTGTGAYPNRQTLTFTPSAGALICTVTGTVEYAQLEVGSFVTSFIPAAATSLTRNADVVTMTGANFSDWYNASEGTFCSTANVGSLAGAFNFHFMANNGTANNVIGIRKGPSSSGNLAAIVQDAGVSQASILCTSTLPAGQNFSAALAYKANDFAAAGAGATPGTDTAGTIPTLDRLDIGSQVGSLFLNGTIANLRYWPQRLINAEVQAFSK